MKLSYAYICLLDGSSGKLKLFRENNDSRDFWVPGKNKVFDSEIGTH